MAQGLDHEKLLQEAVKAAKKAARLVEKVMADSDLEAPDADEDDDDEDE